METLKITHADLVQRAVRWLRNTRGCTVVFAEPCTAASSIPDAIGWQMARSVLVECKTSRSDFRADRLKPSHRSDRVLGWERWYLTPPGLVKAEEVPEGWGLLEAHPRMVRRVVKAAPVQMNERAMSDEVVLLVSMCRRYQLGVEWRAKEARFAPCSEETTRPSRRRGDSPPDVEAGAGGTVSRIFDPQAARGRPRRLPDRTPRCGGVVVGREQPQPERVRVDRSFRFRALSVASRLHELEGWEPCGSRLAELQEALSGAGGISQGTWDRLQCWAGRWQALSEDVRVFYAATAGRFDAAGNALWHILQDGPPLPGAGLRAIRELYEDIHGGTPAAFDLDPRPWRGRDLPGGPR